MKVVILAGGLGTRLSEETHLRPKPMIEVEGRPILWHLLKIYSAHGLNDFVICAGYKGYVIKEYFANYFLHMSDVTFDIKENKMVVHERRSEPWKITVVDTGDDTMTGGRLARIAPYVYDETFCFTYGDGLADVDITALVSYHRSHGGMATMTAVQPPGRFGAVAFSEMDERMVGHFQEKPEGDGAWINGGFFVLNPSVFSHLKDGDGTVWEQSPLQTLARAGELGAYRHRGFWMPMDTLRDKVQLEALWDSGKAPWKVW